MWGCAVSSHGVACGVVWCVWVRLTLSAASSSPACSAFCLVICSCRRAKKARTQARASSLSAKEAACGWPSTLAFTSASELPPTSTTAWLVVRS